MSCLFDCFTDDIRIQNDDYIPQNIMLPTIQKKKKTIKKIDKSTQTDIIPKKKKSNKKFIKIIEKIYEPGSQIV